VEKEFWIGVGKKIIETIISVKVLTIAALLTISTYLILHNHLSGGEWAAVNGGVISTVYALREAFKVSKVKNNGKNGKHEDIKV